ncbi:hypothetical protein CDD83_1748 [Cordyceps sp. RAO-2017]|nr:hypothetical protein CDD83_1748 [Cordyceps sp. RAO-2017]
MQGLLLALCCLSSLASPAVAVATERYEYPARDECKAFPGSRAWPSRSVWQGLNEKLGGRLLAPPPPGAVCHPGQATYNPDQCPNVQRLWPTFEFHAQNPVSIVWNQWNNFSCLPDPKAPCDGRRYPPYVVDASSAKHVKLGVDFARKHNVRLVVKGTGYDFLGRSTGAGALSIWTHHMSWVQYHPAGQFKLSGSRRPFKGTAVTVGAGTQMADIYSTLDKHKQMFIGAMGPSVGIAGFLSSGGHSNLSGRYGLGADNIVEMEVVTPKGDIVTVNEDHNADLFWALRGGGGSTFGIVTKFTLRTYPTPKVLAIRWVAGVDPKEPRKLDFAAELLSKFPDMIDSGLLGWSAVVDNMPNPVPAPGDQAPPRNISGLFGINAILGTNEGGRAEEVLKPVADAIQTHWNGKAKLTLQTTQYPSYWAYVTGVYNPRPAGVGWWEASRLLDKKVLTSNPKALAHALKAFDGNLFAMILAGKGVQKPPGGRNSVNPPWRSAYMLSSK